MTGGHRKDTASEKTLLVGCGQDISRNVISDIDFEIRPCSLMKLPAAVPQPSGNTCYTQEVCARGTLGGHTGVQCGAKRVTREEGQEQWW